MDKEMTMAIARCRMYISADEGNALMKVERWSSDSKKNCCYYSITNSLHSLCDNFGDNQVYVCHLETNVPVKIKEESCENQCWNPVDDFCYRLLPTDHANFFSCRWP